MLISAQRPMHAWGARFSVSAALGILLLLSALASPAAAALDVGKDVFSGTAIIPSGQTSPVQVNPHDISVRADGAIGVGYAYRAAGQAFGEVPGSFTYLEHGYLYFKNPADPRSMVGSRFVSGVFTLQPQPRENTTRAAIQIADTAPDLYRSGIKTVENYSSGIQTVVDKLGSRAHKDDKSSLSTNDTFGLLGATGSLTYGWFTFTNNHGTFTGYATPDFTRFIIPITFDY